MGQRGWGAGAGGAVGAMGAAIGADAEVAVGADGLLAPLAADLADEFGGKAEEGGDHILGDTLDKIGKAARELMITFLAGKVLDKVPVLLGCGKGALGNQAKIAVEAGDLVEQYGSGGTVEDGKPCSLDSLKIKMRRLLPVEALLVGDPPVLDAKLDDLFGAGLLDKVEPEAAFEHKIIRLADLLLFQQEFFFLHLTELEGIGQQAGLAVVEVNIFSDMGDKRSKITSSHDKAIRDKITGIF
jgi:hypothetical protein